MRPSVVTLNCTFSVLIFINNIFILNFKIKILILNTCPWRKLLVVTLLWSNCLSYLDLGCKANSKSYLLIFFCALLSHRLTNKTTSFFVWGMSNQVNTVLTSPLLMNPLFFRSNNWNKSAKVKSRRMARSCQVLSISRSENTMSLNNCLISYSPMNTRLLLSAFRTYGDPF